MIKFFLHYIVILSNFLISTCVQLFKDNYKINSSFISRRKNNKFTIDMAEDKV